LCLNCADASRECGDGDPSAQSARLGVFIQTQSDGLLEFEAGFEVDQALSDLREKVDIATAELSPDTDEPTVHEVNVALFPLIVVTLYADVAERELVAQSAR
jgi:multidrug efflux pump subunit AcrB